MSYMLLAASLAKLGQLGEAKGAAARVLELQPSYRFGKHFAGVDCAPPLAASLSEALSVAGYQNSRSRPECPFMALSGHADGAR